MSRRNPATILRGGYFSVPSTRSGVDATRSSFPNILPHSVRLATSGCVFSGMKSWQRISEPMLVNLLENIVFCIDDVLLKWIILYISILLLLRDS